jgi:hypothetical protein
MALNIREGFLQATVIVMACASWLIIGYVVGRRTNEVPAIMPCAKTKPGLHFVAEGIARVRVYCDDAGNYTITYCDAGK